MRKFEKYVCSKYDTKELPSELAARTRRQQWKAIQKPTTTPALTRKHPATKGPQQRKFNLETYKYHALGDYAPSIRLHGPLDGYSSQLVSYPVLSTRIYKTLSLIRVNLNTADQKDSILSFVKEDMLLELEKRLVESDYFN
jgi:hypothetical protein